MPNGEPKNTPRLRTPTEDNRGAAALGGMQVATLTFQEAAEAAFDALAADDEDTPADEPEPESDEVETEETAEDDEPDPDEAGEGEESEDDDPEGDDEDPDAEEDEEEPQEPSEAIELAEDAVVRLPDGTEVSGDELRKGWLRQQDYTKKTQEVAEQRQQVETQAQQVQDAYEQLSGWVSERAANPAQWMAEIASESGDATTTLARVIRSLVDADALDDEFVQMFGLQGSETVNRLASLGDRDDRIGQLERQLQQDRDARAQEQRRQQIVAEYERQWDDVKTAEGLAFETSEAEREARVELLKFMRDTQTTDLSVAYAAMTHQRARKQPDPAPTPDPAVQQKKRATRAMTPRSSATASQRQVRPKAKDVRSAAALALEDFAASSA